MTSTDLDRLDELRANALGMPTVACTDWKEVVRWSHALHEAYPAMAAELRRLRAIKLPVTADGMPIVPGMEVWLPFTDGFDPIRCVATINAVDADTVAEVRKMRPVYSTREAAESAGGNP